MMRFPSLINAQRVMWVKRLFRQKRTSNGSSIMRTLPMIGGKFIFSCNYLFPLLKLSLPEFYIELLEARTNRGSLKRKCDYIGEFVFLE